MGHGFCLTYHIDFSDQITTIGDCQPIRIECGFFIFIDNLFCHELVKIFVIIESECFWVKLASDSKRQRFEKVELGKIVIPYLVFPRFPIQFQIFTIQIKEINVFNKKTQTDITDSQNGRICCAATEYGFEYF